MKKFVCIFMAAAMIGVLTSCDSKKSEVKDLTKKFIESINQQDRVTVYDMYPNSKALMGLLPEKLDAPSIKVTADDSTGNYVATFNAETGQRLVFKTDSAGAFKITDSYGVLKMDSINREFAIKTGIPLQETSDLKFADLMNEDSLFMSLLTIAHFEELQGNLVRERGYWTWGRNAGGYYLNIFQTITNNGETPVKGEDYNVEFRLADLGGNGIKTTKVVPGVDLAPSETTELMTSATPFYNAAINRTLQVDVIIKFKNMTTQAMMLKYGKFTGEEYHEYLQTLKEIEESNRNSSKEEGEIPVDTDSIPDEE